ncbi:hypothetical protein BC939DRAFT_451659 [Gamsiella multidivaricata]|uniref:uncharacterized protein n=1 Tax=Gamsiella multidivaricata TaxID=101098 RepID=UPI0022210023|nr:uncharacterized protein BC939DRAFT_451659 [Gamsiella multidivaricata]KAG0354087.1 hypothetical protein BGZ54_001854 [Gamsiella multidivaricata]KAI7823314.1 hypothetical protein BC939DRAFT_451659 [Gamsiella multidivaricata]
MVVISIPTTISKEPETTAFGTCIDTKETLLLEFQGAVEMDGASWAGNPLGQLSILEGGVKAQVVIGNHRLEGKVMKLDKPLLLIQKQQKPKDAIDHETAPAGLASKDNGKEPYREPDNDFRDRRSPFSSMPPSSPPGHDDDDDTMTSTTLGNVTGTDTGIAQSGPMTPPGSEDVIQYNTVAIIRQKVLFNIMPVPIIHTERRGLTVIKRGV